MKMNYQRKGVSKLPCAELAQKLATNHVIRGPMKADTIIRQTGDGTGRILQGGLQEVAQANPHHVQVIVLCAEELQFDKDAWLDEFEEIVRAPNDDSVLSKKQAAIAVSAARKVVQHFNKGNVVLVSCAQGRNRSGLVSAMALHMITGRPGKECVAIVKKCRDNALTNPWFNRFLDQIPEKRRQSKRYHSLMRLAVQGRYESIT
jgi:hypothetical protein